MRRDRPTGYLVALLRYREQRREITVARSSQPMLNPMDRLADMLGVPRDSLVEGLALTTTPDEPRH